MGLVDEVRGDAYLAKKDTALARQAYQLALAEIPNAEISRPVLQMKFDNLAENKLS
jgi:predicted negative regulator of RcsB-dependent stress response